MRATGVWGAHARSRGRVWLDRSVHPTVVVAFLGLLARLCRPALKIARRRITPQLSIGCTARVQAQLLAAVQLRHLRLDTATSAAPT